MHVPSDPLQIPPDLDGVPLLQLRERIVPLVLTDTAKQALDDEVVAVRLDASATWLGSVEHRITLLREGPQSDARANLDILLQCMRRFYRGVDALSAADYARAQADFRVAVYGYTRVERRDESDVAVALGLYTEGMVELLEGNVATAERLISAAQGFLVDRDNLDPQTQATIDHLDLEVLSIHAVVQWNAGLPAEAAALYRTAAKKAEAMASAASEDDSSKRSLELGLSKYYYASALFLESTASLGKFGVDRIPKDISKPAEEAVQLFTDTAPPILVASATYLAETLRVLEDVATVLTKVFTATFKPDVRRFDELHQRVRRASDAIAGEGTVMLPLVRACAALDEQLNNIERLVKPSKRDFGKFSGLIACAMFAPLLAAAALISHLLSLDASGTVIVETCSALALAAGFGLSAVRYRSMLPGAK